MAHRPLFTRAPAFQIVPGRPVTGPPHPPPPPPPPARLRRGCATGYLWLATVWYGLSTLVWLLGGAGVMTFVLPGLFASGGVHSASGGPLDGAETLTAILIYVVYAVVVGGEPVWAGWCLRRAWRLRTTTLLVGLAGSLWLVAFACTGSLEPINAHAEQIAAALRPNPTDLTLLPALLRSRTPRTIGVVRSVCDYDECVVPPRGVAVEVYEALQGNTQLTHGSRQLTDYVFRSDALARRFFDANQYEGFGGDGTPGSGGLHTPPPGARQLAPPPGVVQPAICLTYDARGVHDARCRVLVGSVIVESQVSWMEDALGPADPTLAQALVTAGIGPAERAQQGAPPP